MQNFIPFLENPWNSRLPWWTSNYPHVEIEHEVHFDRWHLFVNSNSDIFPFFPQLKEHMEAEIFDGRLAHLQKHLLEREQVCLYLRFCQELMPASAMLFL